MGRIACVDCSGGKEQWNIQDRWYQKRWASHVAGLNGEQHATSHVATAIFDNLLTTSSGLRQSLKLQLPPTFSVRLLTKSVTNEKPDSRSKGYSSICEGFPIRLHGHYFRYLVLSYCVM